MTMRVQSLCVRLGRFELGPIDLAPREGEVLALVGPNGGGKTTLLRAMTGLVRALSGSVQIDGRAVEGLGSADRARRIAFVPQRPAVPPGLCVRELVELGRLRRGRDPVAVERAMAAVGVDHIADQSVQVLSAGQVHRVAVARALCQCGDGTRLLALDEPTSTLDPAWSRELARLVREVASRGVAVVVATHDLAFAGACCDAVALVSAGRVVASGPWEATASVEALGALFGTPFAHAHGLAARPIALPRW